MNISRTSLPRGATGLVAAKAKLASLVAYGKPGPLLRRAAGANDAKPRGGLGILPPFHRVSWRVRWRAPDAKSPAPDHLRVPFFDMAVHPRDHGLVIGTHGRSGFVMDIGKIQAAAATRGRE